MSVFDIFYNATLGAERAKKTQSEFDQRYQMAHKGRKEREAQEQEDYRRKQYEEAQKQAIRERESDRRQQLTMELVRQRGEAEEYKREQPWIEEKFRREHGLKVGKERQSAYEYEATAQAKLDAERRSNFFKAQGDKISAARVDETIRRNAFLEDKARYVQEYEEGKDKQARIAKQAQEARDENKLELDIAKARSSEEREKRTHALAQSREARLQEEFNLRKAAGVIPKGIPAKDIIKLGLTIRENHVKFGVEPDKDTGLPTIEGALDKALEILQMGRDKAQEEAGVERGLQVASKIDNYDPSALSAQPFNPPQNTGMPSQGMGPGGAPSPSGFWNPAGYA